MRCGSYSLRPGPLDCCARCTVAPPGVLKARGTQHPRLCALLQIRATLPPCWGECAWARLGHAEHHVPGAASAGHAWEASEGLGVLVSWVPPTLGTREARRCWGATPSGPWEMGTREAPSCPRFPGAAFKWPESRRRASQMLLR